MMPPIIKPKMEKHQPQHQLQPAQRDTHLLGFSRGPSSSSQQSRVRNRKQRRMTAQATIIRTTCLTVFGPSPSKWPLTWRNLSVSVKNSRFVLIMSFTSVKGVAADLKEVCNSSDASSFSWLLISVRASASVEATLESKSSTIVCRGSINAVQKRQLWSLSATSLGRLLRASCNSLIVWEARSTESWMTCVSSIAELISVMNWPFWSKLSSMSWKIWRIPMKPKNLGSS
mmetsp:Transcript_34825/g.74093  ORF Transcript_34825/g.74093 Transcript_34825/m.74093 type:complete len:229 (-) Transcript_34825:480-1166(-)